MQLVAEVGELLLLPGLDLLLTLLLLCFTPVAALDVCDCGFVLVEGCRALIRA